MSKNKKRYTNQQVIEALNKSKGYVSKAAALLKCTTRTVYNYIEREAEIKEARDVLIDARHDHVEMALHKRINSGDTTAIIFYLKTQCKLRGYVERQEIKPIGKLSVEYTNDWRETTED